MLLTPAQIKPKSFESRLNSVTRGGCVSCLRACFGQALSFIHTFSPCKLGGGGGGGRRGGGGVQARSKDQEILEEGGGAGPSNLPRRDHE